MTNAKITKIEFFEEKERYVRVLLENEHSVFINPCNEGFIQSGASSEEYGRTVALACGLNGFLHSQKPAPLTKEQRRDLVEAFNQDCKLDVKISKQVQKYLFLQKMSAFRSWDNQHINEQ